MDWDIKNRKPSTGARKARKHAGESFSEAILCVTDGEEEDFCEFLDRIDPTVRREIAKSIMAGKKKLARVRPRKVSR